ncbi:MAG TPA: response regulator, partial [Candidatus Dormibacteraeota bacterium]|nr:response regulator [Candidatus Dormibacteraeota bacterium]
MRKLLVVDDDEALRRLIRIELSDTYEVVDSGEPEQGLALALESNPDAILLDLRMPKYSGYELLKTFTSFSRTHMIPVIVVSGTADGQTPEHCKQLGATAYFEKPIDFESLRACLQRIAKPRVHIARSEVRVPLRVSLILRGTDRHGEEFESVATTEDVSLSGFLCDCATELANESVVDVFLAVRRNDQVGRAKIVQSSSK